ncbi:MAG: orotidine-5'-phosphate decarboxylase [bacterium]
MAKKPQKKKTELIVALDTQTLRGAQMLLKELKGLASCYQIGLPLFVAEGPKAVELVMKNGGQVFLDLKLHDINQAVKDAVRSAVRMGVYALSLHLSAGGRMLEAAAGVHPRPRLWGITVLTSMDHEDFAALGYSRSVRDMAGDLAKLGLKHRMDGIICSGHEAVMLRSRLGSGAHLIVAGIRPANMETHEQKRTITPAKAAELGADFIIVGRPITEAPHPASAVEKILKEIK